MKTRTIGLTLLTLLASPLYAAPAQAAVANDEVTSQKLKEADGTSGQNTNSGSGVKTGHLQDGAVTTGKIAAGAVTDAKITGPISGSKISSTNLNADTVDGQHAAAFAPVLHSHPVAQVTGLDAALAGKSDVTHDHDPLYQRKHGKVAVVAQTGGDYANPATAMSDLAAWCGAPSSTNPCLLKIMPGIYDVSDEGIMVQPHVDIEGSGPSNTRVINNDTRGFPVLAYYWTGSENSISDLTLEASAYSMQEVNPLRVTSGASVSLRNVTLVAIGPTAYGIDIQGYPSTPSSITLSNVTIYSGSTSGGPYDGLAIGIAYESASVRSFSSAIHGSISITRGNSMTGAGNQLFGAVGGGGTFKCVHCFDGNFDPIP